MIPARVEALIRIHLGVGVTLSVGCTLLPAGLWHDVLYTFISFGYVVVTVVGIRRHRPAAALGWWVVTTGVVGWASADVLWAVFNWILHISQFSVPGRRAVPNQLRRMRVVRQRTCAEFNLGA
ncbi:hypothetical protein Kisp01_23440 [Kineosporia sp. NBRC 101677]|uniref:hypothetical protein n=1 Tax=Kineosporia sp. NBRC 101677 TaxID=3032197 RepID=UPI000B1A26D3|nr:hypothetical protein [Kineosporia sp. NBRC 101677]GLY15329.1 hypothetical protein Kisp01_23440 [Kineosporia sp. NBRC 101677]